MNRDVFCRWAAKVLSPLGFVLHRRYPNHHYVPDYFGAKAHKYKDIRSLEPFGQLAAAVISEQRTKLYYDRLFTLYHTLTQSTRTAERSGPFVFCEVGTYRGGTMKFLCSCCEELKTNYRGIVCDTFEGHDAKDLQPTVTKHKEGDFSDTSIESVREYLKDYSVQLIKGRIQESLSAFPENIHFLHLDVDLYEPTAFALASFGSRISHGGSIVVDDHGFSTCPGVEQAVEEFLQSQIGKAFFYLPLTTGQCVLVRYGSGA